jgi:murein DD-endopeptidase MepM/ murein hydrolase activator NlpD
LKKSNALKADKKLKGEKKYFTIMLVPHSSDKVKTIRISRLYTKLVFIIIILVTLSVHTLFRINDINNENTALKLSSVQLYNLAKDQKTLLSEKVEEINSLLEKEDNANINIAEFMDKYRDVVDKYVSGRIDSGLASRSGNRTGSSFAKDIEELREILTALSEVNKLKDENFIDLTETENKLRKYLDSLPDLWPVNGRVSSKFGYRLDPFTFRRSYHKGIDIAASYGTSIKASASGKVILAGSYNELGKTVIVDHGNGITTVYGHTSKVLVKKGQTVKKGAVIAKVGSSGRSTGSHLHFEIRINGEPIDPFKYLD